eukprot:scaffold253950_cov21-Tisochrysis_lutea.AAC.1
MSKCCPQAVVVCVYPRDAYPRPCTLDKPKVMLTIAHAQLPCSGCLKLTSTCVPPSGLLESPTGSPTGSPNVHAHSWPAEIPHWITQCACSLLLTLVCHAVTACACPQGAYLP